MNGYNDGWIRVSVWKIVLMDGINACRKNDHSGYRIR